MAGRSAAPGVNPSGNSSFAGDVPDDWSVLVIVAPISPPPDTVET